MTDEQKTQAFSARAASISGLSMTYNRVLTTLVGIYAAHALGAGLYGSYNLARNIFLVVSVLTPLGLDLALQRYLNQPEIPERIRFGVIKHLRIFALLIAITPLVILLGGFSDWVSAHVFPHPHFSAALSITMLCLPFATDLAVLGGAFRGIFTPVPSIIAVNCIQPTVRALGIIILLALDQGIFAVLYGTVLGYVASSLYLLVKARQILPKAEIPVKEGIGAAKNVLRYAPSMALSLFIFTLARSIDTLAVGYWHTSADAGQYAIVIMAVQLVSIVSSSLGQTLGPALTVAYANNDKILTANLIKQNMLMCSALGAPFCVVIAVWGCDIDLILGPSYKIAPLAFIVGAAGQFVVATTQNASLALTMTNRHNLELLNNIVSLAVQILCCWLLVPGYGIVGAGMATLVSMVVINAMRQIQIGRALGKNIFTLKLFIPLTVSICLAVPFEFLFKHIEIRAWWITGLFVIAYLTVVGLILLKLFLPPKARRSV